MATNKKLTWNTVHSDEKPTFTGPTLKLYKDVRAAIAALNTAKAALEADVIGKAQKAGTLDKNGKVAKPITDDAGVIIGAVGDTPRFGLNFGRFSVAYDSDAETPKSKKAGVKAGGLF